MAELELSPREAYGQLYFLDNTIESLTPEIDIQIGFIEDTGSLVLNRNVQLAGQKTFTLSGSLLVSGSTTQIGNNTLQGNTLLDGTIGIVGNSSLTGSFLVSGSTTQLGNNTLAGNTLLSGSIGIVGNSSLTGSFLVSGSTTQIGNNTLQGNTLLDGTIGIIGNSTLTGSFTVSGSTTQIGNNTLEGNTKLSGSVNITGSLDVLGDINVVSGSGFFRWGNKLFNNGGFYDTTTQSGSANVSQSMMLNSTEYHEGIDIVSGSHIVLQNVGVYNLQFSAQIVDTASGTSTIRIWIKKNGVNVPHSATKLFVGQNDELCASWNWFIQATSPNDYYEIAWQSTDSDTHLVAEVASGNYPEIPSVIVTVSQVA